MLSTNVALSLRKGLWDGAPAMDPLALLYVPTVPGGPMINCVGSGANNSRPVKVHPVDPLLPVVIEPSPFTVICWAELDIKVPLVAPLLSVKERSLISCATPVGLGSKSLSTIVSKPAPGVNAAEALTAPPLVVLPGGVEKGYRRGVGRHPNIPIALIRHEVS